MVSAMVRLWLTSLTVGAIACVSLGCADQNIQGRWRGPFPLEDAKACVLNLYGAQQFDLACQDHTWVGGGRYEDTEDGIQFDFDVLAKRGQRVETLPSLRLDKAQRGNELLLVIHHGQSFRLTRGL
jgi:hypothetical protein